MTRKELVQALEAKWGGKATYLGVPSYAYEINCGAGTYQVDRHGAIRDQEGREFSAEELLSQQQLDTAEESVTIGREELPLSGYVVELPMAGHTAASLRNLINMLASKQQLLVSALGLTHPLLDKLLVEELGQRSLEDVDAFQTLWTEFGSRHCRGLEMDFEKQTLAMKMLKDNPTPDEMAAFCDLAICMNENAKKLKHSSFKPAQDDNPKFALRTWLLRLGMNGDRFKTTRKVLLARLLGNAAFRTPAEEEKHKARLLAKKLKQCEGDGDVC
jgi:hypothetical protein